MEHEKSYFLKIGLIICYIKLLFSSLYNRKKKCTIERFANCIVKSLLPSFDLLISYLLVRFLAGGQKEMSSSTRLGLGCCSYDASTCPMF
jgi:hypothetical protein